MKNQQNALLFESTPAGFDKWVLESGDGNIIGNTAFGFRTKNSVIYASWKNYTLSFDANGGGNVSARTTNYDKTNTLPSASMSYATFIGWYKDKGTTWSNTQKKGSVKVADANTTYIQLDNKIVVGGITYDLTTLYAGWQCTHNYGGWYDFSASQHQHKCAQCGKTENGSHTYPSSWSDYDASNHRRKCNSCPHYQYAGHSWSGWIQTATNHYKKCNACGRTKDSGAHGDGDGNGVCDSCGYVMYSIYTISLHMVPPTAIEYSSAYGTPQKAGTATPVVQDVTYRTDNHTLSANPAPGDFAIKASGGGVSSTWTCVGWSTGSDNIWTGSQTCNQKSNPAEYGSLQDAANANYQGVLYAVYKRNSGSYYICAA